jgi:hypothetical protein
MRILKLKTKNGFVSVFGAEHKEAVLIVSQVNNNIVAKKLEIFLQVYNSENDIGKQPVDFGFLLSFDENITKETIINPNNGEVIQWGTPSYTEVLQFFDIVDEGIVLNSPEVEMWFLNNVEFQSKKLVEQWEIF